MNYFTTLEELKSYRDAKMINQSFLKMVLANRIKKEFKPTIQTILGSYLDTLLTSPDLTDDLFQVGLAKRPSDAIKEFIDIVYNQALIQTEELPIEISSNIELYRNDILSVVREKGYQPKWGDDAVWNSIVKDGQGYWEELISSQGKVLITQEEFENCQNTAQLTCSSPITSRFFQEEEEIVKWYQKPLYWTYEGLECKGLLDILIFDHCTKTIVIPDIKSTGVSSLKEWFQVCRSKSYPFQLSWYKLGVEETYNKLIEKGWTVKCLWIVIPTDYFKPWIVPCTELMLKFGKEGYWKEQRGYSSVLENQNKSRIKEYEYIPGFDEAIKRYKIKEETGLPDFDIEYFETKGKLNDIKAEQHYFT